MFLRHIFISLRPRQWLKNLFVFAPLVFAREFLDPSKLALVLPVFVLFCAAASGIYLLNDVLDRESDRHHPTKKNRPIASGKLSATAAISVGSILLGAALAAAFVLDPRLFGVLAAYVGLQITYSLALKKIVIIDLFSIAGGFVLRVLAGAVVLQVTASPWLIAVSFLITLLLATGKRYKEIQLTSKARSVLGSYRPEFLHAALLTILPATLIAYVFYTLQSEHSPWFLLTAPLVAYGLLRYLLLLESDATSDDPTELVLSDKPLLLVGLIWSLGTLWALL